MKQQCDTACYQSNKDPTAAVIGDVINECTNHGSIHHRKNRRKDPKYVLLRVQKHRSVKHSDPDQDAEYRNLFTVLSCHD